MSASRTQPSRQESQAQGVSGNACAFSIGWPSGFVSRTSDPLDPCFVGRNTDAKANRPTPQQRMNGPAEKFIPPGVRVTVGTHAWEIWRLLRDRGPLCTTGIRSALGLTVPAIHLAMSRRLLPGKAVSFTSMKGQGGQHVYFIGPAPVVEIDSGGRSG